MIKPEGPEVQGSILLTGDNDGVQDSNTIPFQIGFESVDEYRLRFNASVAGANAAELGNNYVSMKFDSDWMEEFYGLGLQYTDWNMKGKQIPLITTEGGVGRGL